MSISITVDTATGNITVAPSTAYFNRGQTVQWGLTNSNGTSLTISFKDGTPFNTQQVSGSNSVESGILTDAPKGVYHYIVAAQVGGTIYVTPGCPEIVVQ